jgi:hypothetical protein
MACSLEVQHFEKVTAAEGSLAEVGMESWELLTDVEEFLF